MDTGYSVSVQGQRNILDVLQTYVSGNKLVITFKNDKRVRTYDPLQVLIRMPSLDRVRLSGSGNIKVSGMVNAPSMETDISGSGNLEMTHLQTSLLDASISGSGNLLIGGGGVTEAQMKISGSGRMDLGQVQAQKAYTRTSGSGDIWIRVVQWLDVSISGSGSVFYRGQPVIKTAISGSGRVVPF
jgi:hypothetical protein